MVINLKFHTDLSNSGQPQALRCFLESDDSFKEKKKNSLDLEMLQHYRSGCVTFPLRLTHGL